MSRIFEEKAKPLPISREMVWLAYKKVRSNKGGAGIDGQSIALFEVKLTDNLYKLWNRMASGSYFPDEVSLNVQYAASKSVKNFTFNKSNISMNLVLRTYVRYNAYFKKSQFIILILAPFPSLNAEINPVNIEKPEVKELISGLKGNPSFPISGFIDVRYYHSLNDKGNVYDKIAKTKTFVSLLEDLGKEEKDIPYLSEESIAYIFTNITYFLQFNITSGSNENPHAFYQPYWIIGTNGVGILGHRFGIKEDVYKTIKEKGIGNLDPKKIIPNATGGVTPFVIFYQKVVNID